MKNKINKYIEYLSYLHLDQQMEKISENFLACNIRSQLPAMNRVFIPNTLQQQDYQDLLDYFENYGFTFWIHPANSIGNAMVNTLGCVKRYSYPLIAPPLNNLREKFSEAILYASDMGKPIYERIGFKEVARVNGYTSLNSTLSME